MLRGSSLINLKPRSALGGKTDPGPPQDLARQRWPMKEIDVKCVALEYKEDTHNKNPQKNEVLALAKYIFATSSESCPKVHKQQAECRILEYEGRDTQHPQKYDAVALAHRTHPTVGIATSSGTCSKVQN